MTRDFHPRLAREIGNFRTARAPLPGHPGLEENLEAYTVVCGGGMNSTQQ